MLCETHSNSFKAREWNVSQPDIEAKFIHYGRILYDVLQLARSNRSTEMKVVSQVLAWLSSFPIVRVATRGRLREGASRKSVP